MLVKFILRRTAMAIPTLVLVSVVVFIMMRAVPGDPVLLMLGDMAKPEQIEAMRRSMGLDQPWAIQYLRWAGGILTGDFGQSITNDLPVLPVMLDKFQVTATVVILAVLLTSLIAVPAGLLAAWKQNSMTDLAVVGAATLLLSVPSFWIGLLMLLLFGLKLGWLPIVGYVSFGENPWAALLYLIMPVATLMMQEMGFVARMARSSTIDVLRLEYITHARAKGLSEPAVLWKHAFRNAFAPTWTVIGLILGSLLGGIAVIETVFTIPGLGRLLVDSIYARDYPMVQGCLLLIAGIYVVVNLIVDLLYPLFDPRVTA
ncbi:MAG TPA: ABC transporter permease [Dongiaceae bacterium]|nr:ABC transporter permease [Dongiaceae bacterium]